MISEYGKQIKAFFHFLFKHLFEVEFGIRVVVEMFIFVVTIYMLLRICYKIISMTRVRIRFINRELIVPLRVRMYERLAFSTSNPNWQERANKIKDAFKEKKNAFKENDSKKSHVGRWIFFYIVLIVWIIGFYYYGEEKRNSYEVFFLGEKATLAFEEWITDTLFNTDEYAIECFFHNKIEKTK